MFFSLSNPYVRQIPLCQLTQEKEESEHVRMHQIKTANGGGVREGESDPHEYQTQFRWQFQHFLYILNKNKILTSVVERKRSRPFSSEEEGWLCGFVAKAKEDLRDENAMVVQHEDIVIQKRSPFLPLSDEEAQLVISRLNVLYNGNTDKVIDAVKWVNNKLDKLWWQRANNYVKRPRLLAPPMPLPASQESYVASRNGPRLLGTQGPEFNTVGKLHLHCKFAMFTLANFLCSC